MIATCGTGGFRSLRWRTSIVFGSARALLLVAAPAVLGFLAFDVWVLFAKAAG